MGEYVRQKGDRVSVDCLSYETNLFSMKSRFFTAKNKQSISTVQFTLLEIFIKLEEYSIELVKNDMSRR